MAWMQMRMPHWASAAPLLDVLEKASKRRAAEGTADSRLALISRPIAGMEADMLLLSPSVARYAALLPGDWVEAPDPTGTGWTLLFSSGATLEDFGLSSS